MTRVARGAVTWSALEAATAACLSAVSAFVVARLAGPASVGIGAAAVSVHVLLWVAVNALFADAIVQCAAIGDAELSSAFWASVLVGMAAALVQVAAGWPLAWAMGDHRLVMMCLVLAPALPLVGAGGAIQGKLTRERAYRALAARTLVGQASGTMAGVAVAAWGGGAWALVVQQGVISAAGALSLLAWSGWRPGWVLRIAPVLALLRVGLVLTASTLTLHGRYRVFALLVGGAAGPAALGQVHMAFRLVDSARELASTALWRLMLPAMSDRQHDPAALRGAVDRWLAGYGRIVFPASGLLLLSIGPAVLIVLGPAWAPSARAALPLILLAAWNFLLFAGNVAMVARGRPGAVLAVQTIAGALTIGAVAVLRPADPAAAAWLWLAGQVAASLLGLRPVARALDWPVGRQVRAGLPWLALAAGATGFAALVPPAPSVLGTVALRTAALALAYGAGVLVWGRVSGSAPRPRLFRHRPV